MNTRNYYFTLAFAFSLIIAGSSAVLAQNQKKKEKGQTN